MLNPREAIICANYRFVTDCKRNSVSECRFCQGWGGRCWKDSPSKGKGYVRWQTPHSETVESWINPPHLQCV
jgi:hypothetical protein